MGTECALNKMTTCAEAEAAEAAKAAARSSQHGVSTELVLGRHYR